MTAIIGFGLACIVIAGIAIVLHVRHMVRLDQEDRPELEPDTIVPPHRFSDGP